MREETAGEIKKNSDAKLIDQKQAVIQQVDAIVTPGAKLVPAEILPAGIYFHIKNDGQRKRAANTARQIAGNPNIVVPGIQRVFIGPDFYFASPC